MLRNCLLSFVLVFTANQRSKNMFISHLAIGFLSVVHLSNVALQVPEYLSCTGQRKKSTDLASVDFPCQTASPLSGKKREKEQKRENFPARRADHYAGAIFRSCYVIQKCNITAWHTHYFFFFFVCKGTLECLKYSPLRSGCLWSWYWEGTGESIIYNSNNMEVMAPSENKFVTWWTSIKEMNVEEEKKLIFRNAPEGKPL